MGGGLNPPKPTSAYAPVHSNNKQRILQQIEQLVVQQVYNKSKYRLSSYPDP